MLATSSSSCATRLLLLCVVVACSSSIVSGLPISTLLAFKNSISNPSKLSSWNVSHHVCEWKGVVCEQADILEISVNLRGLGLQGTLSEQWGGITNLVSIDLAENELFGQVPSTWTGLLRLRSLSLERNMLTINVTELHTMLSQLEHLDISGNVLIKPEAPEDAQLHASGAVQGAASTIAVEGPMSNLKTAWNQLVDRSKAAAAEPSKAVHRSKHYDSSRALIEAEMPLNSTDDIIMANSTLLHLPPPPPAEPLDMNATGDAATNASATSWNLIASKIPRLSMVTKTVSNLDVKVMAPEQQAVTTVMLSTVALQGQGAEQFSASNAQALAKNVASSAGLQESQVLVMMDANVTTLVQLAGYAWDQRTRAAVVSAYSAITGFPVDHITAEVAGTSAGGRRRLADSSTPQTLDVNVQFSGMSVDNATSVAKVVNTTCATTSACTITLAQELGSTQAPTTSNTASVVSTQPAAVTTQVTITVALTQKDVETNKASVVQQSLSSQTAMDSLLQKSGLASSTYTATISTPPTSVAITTVDAGSGSGPSQTLKVVVGILGGIAGVGVIAAVIMFARTRRSGYDSDDSDDEEYHGSSFSGSSMGGSRGKKGKGKKGKKKQQVPIDRRPLQHDIIDVEAMSKQQQAAAYKEAQAVRIGAVATDHVASDQDVVGQQAQR